MWLAIALIEFVMLCLRSVSPPGHPVDNLNVGAERLNVKRII